MKSPEHNQEQEEARKKRYLIIGVGIFSAIIFILWLGSLRFSMNSGAFNISSQERETWQDDLDDSMSFFQDNLNLLNESNQVTENTEMNVEGEMFLQEMTDNLSEQTIKTEVSIEDPQELEIIKSESDELLQTLENKINNNLSCPAFINCMPGPDRVGPCSIPPGCEDITQIAY